MFVSSVGARALFAPIARCTFSVSGEGTFLEMVSEYLDKAGTAANIPLDRLAFLKSPDYSLKFNIPFKTGILHNN
jgi:hypothetical protein